MLNLGIAELHKNPSIVNKKNKEVKGYFIPIMYKNLVQDIIEELEYKSFATRNKSLIATKDEDETLTDGLEKKIA